MDIRKYADDDIIARGINSYLNGDVIGFEKLTDSVYRGSVKGFNGKPELVYLDIENMNFSRCDCSYFKNSSYVCSDMIALYFALFPKKMYPYLSLADPKLLENINVYNLNGIQDDEDEDVQDEEELDKDYKDNDSDDEDIDLTELDKETFKEEEELERIEREYQEELERQERKRHEPINVIEGYGDDDFWESDYLDVDPEEADDGSCYYGDELDDY